MNSREEFEQRHIDRYEEKKLTSNNQCPVCGADWNTLAECFSGNGFDREQAILIVNNCATCRDHFDYLLPVYSELEIILVKEVLKCQSH